MRLKIHDTSIVHLQYIRPTGYIKTVYYVLEPQEFSLSQVSDKVVMVIC